ncbi:MAG: hypothetical protein BWY77_00518 [bacterium ADurb.Bin431]|nr:MAG: hypothetical protein BWY77_00518 [bacterium ADurb.Bin431]
MKQYNLILVDFGEDLHILEVGEIHDDISLELRAHRDFTLLLVELGDRAVNG